ncbi:MAG: AmmeMemoRadiSam system radical SAM enzyme [Deltaproteobacteria bacterium]
MIKEARLWEKQGEQKVHCFLCAHECKIAESKFGICGVRQNIQGTLQTMIYADVVAANIDPIEKKPLYHFLPGSLSFSIATVGCNFKCGFCQNWQISQTSTKDGYSPRREVPPAAVVEEAQKNKCASISYTYTEPTIFFEYAYDTARLAHEAGLYNIFVTNGYMTWPALEMIRPYLDAANVDLKSFSDDAYRKNCKARLQPVLDTIAAMKSLGVWVEVTTLVIPGENDSDDELKRITAFLAGVDPMIPWHISRFHPDYEFTDHKATPLTTLHKAKEIGQQAGLAHIYLGNVPEGTDTFCYRCRHQIIQRRYMGLNNNQLKDGRCPHCGAVIAGVWS